MHDDERELLEPAEGDPPSPEFVEQLWTRLDEAWTTRDIPERTDPSPTAIDLAVHDERDQPMSRNRVAILLVAAAAAVIVIAGLVVITDDDNDDTTVDVANEPETTEATAVDDTTVEDTTAEDTASTTDPSFEVTYIDVDAGSTVAASEDFAWVVGDAEGQLSTIDLATNTVVSTAELPVGSRNAWYAFGSVWIGNNDDETVVRFDPDTGAVVATIDVGGPPTWLEGGDESVWLANGNGGEAVRIDPATNAIVARIPIGDSAGGLHTNAEGVWIRDLAGSVHRIDPATDTVVATIAIPSGGPSLAAGPDAVWAPSFESGSLYRIDPATDSVVADVDIGAAVAAEARLPSNNFGGGSLWVRFVCDSDECDRQGVVRVDPETDEVVAIEDLPADWNPISGISVGPTTAWTSTDNAIARIDF